MRNAAIMLGTFLAFALGASAQVAPLGPVLFETPISAVGSFAVASPDAPGSALSARSFASSEPADPPQGVYGVFQNFNFQAYVGYTFFRFYELPNATDNLNGLDASLAYYPRSGWFGADGELAATFGSQAGVSTKSVLGFGGARVRWEATRGIEIWAHGMAGGSHFSPQTPYGSENAFAFEFGGGLDFNPHHRRLSYRLQGDVVGTHFYGTYQYGPKISAGVVYKF